jgi:hypothetical protein
MVERKFAENKHYEVCIDASSYHTSQCSAHTRSTRTKTSSILDAVKGLDPLMLPCNFQVLKNIIIGNNER